MNNKLLTRKENINEGFSLNVNHCYRLKTGRPTTKPIELPSRTKYVATHTKKTTQRVLHLNPDFDVRLRQEENDFLKKHLGPHKIRSDCNICRPGLIATHSSNLSEAPALGVCDRKRPDSRRRKQMSWVNGGRLATYWSECKFVSCFMLLFSSFLQDKGPSNEKIQTRWAVTKQL